VAPSIEVTTRLGLCGDLDSRCPAPDPHLGAGTRDEALHTLVDAVDRGDLAAAEQLAYPFDVERLAAAGPGARVLGCRPEQERYPWLCRVQDGGQSFVVTVAQSLSTSKWLIEGIVDAQPADGLG
jgi:hypothetical protein